MKPKLLAQALCLALFLAPPAGATTVVHFETTLGGFDVDLFDTTAPITVANFLDYITDGDYVDSFVHRSADGPAPTFTPFVIQGGGFRSAGDPNDPAAPQAVPTEAAIQNEFGASNLRGTIAMARIGGQVNSATSQWFINLGDNNFLDNVDGGFTVFGVVLGNGMQVVDAIAALPDNTPQFGSPFTELPLIDFVGGAVQNRNLVFTDLTIVPEPSTLLGVGLGLALLGLRRRAG